MAGVNRVILIGNLGREPEIRSFEGGVKKASFPLATTETYRNREGERTEHTEWHNLILWRGLAEIAEKYLHKGSSIYVEGRIRSRSWEDPSGQKKYITEVEVLNMVMLGGKRDEGNGASAQPPEVDSGEVSEDDLPF